jgi:hypothetical protein
LNDWRFGRISPPNWPEPTFASSYDRAILTAQATQTGDIVMSQRIDQFHEDLRLKLANIDSGLGKLKAKIDGKAEHAEQEVRSHLDKVRSRMEQGRTKVAAAQVEIKNWADEKKTETSDKIAEWKSKREAVKLQNRADRAERYAAAAADIAVAAIDEAEEAALEAWLARQDANSVQPKPAPDLVR